MPQKTGRIVPADWFAVPHIGYWVAVLSGMALVEFMYLAPEKTPVQYMGPLGRLVAYMLVQTPLLVKLIFYGANLIHLCEGVVAFTMCRKLELNTAATIKWTLQTTIVGFSSFFKLKAKADKVDKH